MKNKPIKSKQQKQEEAKTRQEGEKQEKPHGKVIAQARKEGKECLLPITKK